MSYAQPSPPTSHTLFFTRMSAIGSNACASGEFRATSFFFSSSNSLALLLDAQLFLLVRVEQPVRQFIADLAAESLEQIPCIHGSVDRPPTSCRVRTRRCLQTASSTTLAPGQPCSLCTVLLAGFRHKSMSSLWHWRRAVGHRTVVSAV